jgi:hypothetical protein
MYTIILSFVLVIFLSWYLATVAKKVIKVLRNVVKALLLFSISSVSLTAYLRPQYILFFFQSLCSKYVIPIIKRVDAYMMSLHVDIDYEFPIKSLNTISLPALSPHVLITLLVLVVSLSLCYLFVKKHFSGGRPGHQQENHHNNSSPFLMISPQSLLSTFQQLFSQFPNSTSNPTPSTASIKTLEQAFIAIQTLQSSVDRLLAIATIESEEVFAINALEEPLINPKIASKLATMTPTEALRELNDEVKRIKDDKKKPKFLTEEEKALPADELYLKLKQENIIHRETDFLSQLQQLPADVQEWSLTDIKRWFRDRRHELWAIRQIKANKPIFICPTCEKARDAESHRCVPLWNRPVTRAGIPLQQQTYMTQSPQGLRIGQRTTLDTNRITDIEDRITQARNSTAEANSRLAQLHASARATTSTTIPVKSENDIFPYANNPKIQNYHQQPPVIDLTDDTQMEVITPSSSTIPQQNASVNATNYYQHQAPLYYYPMQQPHYQLVNQLPCTTTTQQTPFLPAPTKHQPT